VRSTAAAVVPEREFGLVESLCAHWPEYLCEAAGLGLFMVAACVVTVLLEHPMSALNQTLESVLARHALSGLAMGATAVAIFTSPLGQRSGAHLNPSFTLNYYMLGKISRWDAVFYVAAQFVGGMAGVAVASLLVGSPLGHAAVRYAATAPGPHGVGIAFTGEATIACVLMLTVLAASNSRRWSRATPYLAGVLIATYITFEAPLSGMSMNPARTFGSAVAANVWTALWVYFTAPLLGMFVAARIYCGRIYCAKLHHHNNKRCIFRCSHSALMTQEGENYVQ
jgi:aquaporin Z